MGKEIHSEQRSGAKVYYVQPLWVTRGSIRRVGRNFLMGEYMPDHPYSLEMTYKTALEAVVLLILFPEISLLPNLSRGR